MDALINRLDAADDVASRAYAAGKIDPDVVQTVRSLRRMAMTIRIRQSTGGRQSAWAALRGAYRDDILEHHHAINRMAQVSRQLNDLATTRALATGDPDRIVSELERMEAAWNVCADFLASGVLPYLRELRQVFSAKYYQERVGDPAIWERWTTLLQTEVTENDIPFGRLLSRLLLEPSEFNEETRRQLRSEIGWLQAFFLGIQRPPNGRVGSLRRQTFLFRWLGECPAQIARLRDYLDSELTQANGRACAVSTPAETLQAVENLEVFVPDGLLREVASTLANNVQEHGTLPNTETSLEINVVGRNVEAIFTSIGSARGMTRRLGRRGGLAGLAGRLEPFDAKIEGRVVGSDFLTAIVMSRWDGKAV